ncbi:tRNA pseudouridine synthase B [Erysipelotrichaceae bacterium]|nr:tRNA pseudouridine synthase B [Erysipelotrichaceae bacterium]
MDLNGILVVNKPKGMTSHDVVQRLRRTYSMKKIGHTGTLDPMVDGVLVVCFGRATKLAEYLTNETKVYRATICFGISTDTEDITGTILEKKAITKVKAKEICATFEKTLQTFIGIYEQIPPMYSAVKINGKKLYEYARNAEIVERKPRTLEVYKMEMDTTSIKTDEVEQTLTCTFDVTASKGLYVRTLCVDIGKKFNLPATMSNLTRLQSGNYTVTDAIPLAEIMEQKPELRGLAEMTLDMQTVEVAAEVAAKLRVGYRLPHYFVGEEKIAGIFLVREEKTRDMIGIYAQSEKYPDKYASIKIL